MVFFHILITKDACKANAWVQNADNYMQMLKKESLPYLEDSRQGSDCNF